MTDAMQPTREMVEQAALWHARLGEEQDVANRSAFDAWRALDPLHVVAFERIAGIDARLRPQGAIEQAALKDLWRSRRRVSTLLGILVLVGAFTWVAPRHPAWALRLAEYRTEAGEQRQATLADGSRLIIGTDSALDTHIALDERSVELLRGEIHATVAKGLDAPFVVHTADGTARALGTAYTVRKNPGDTIVTVLESHVEVCVAASAVRDCLELAPGQRARLYGNGVARLPDIAIDSAAAWTRGWLAVDETPLADVLAELNRYRRTPILYDAAALSRLSVSGYFPLRDTDRALGIIARSLPIVVDRSDPSQPRVQESAHTRK